MSVRPPSRLSAGTLFLVGLAVFSGASCRMTGAQSQAADVAAVRRLIEGIIAADNAEDLDTVLTYYADDAVLLAPTGPNIAGIDAIRSHYGELFATADFEIESRIEEVIVSGDWAIARGVNDVLTTPTAGDNPVRVSSKYLMSLRRDPTHGWRIEHLMWSNQAAPPGE